MNKTYCEYCHCVTFDDERGNCLACGAPRTQEQPYGVLRAPRPLSEDEVDNIRRMWTKRYYSTEYAPILFASTNADYQTAGTGKRMNEFVGYQLYPPSEDKSHYGMYAFGKFPDGRQFYVDAYLTEEMYRDEAKIMNYEAYARQLVECMTPEMIT